MRLVAVAVLALALLSGCDDESFDGAAEEGVAGNLVEVSGEVSELISEHAFRIAGEGAEEGLLVVSEEVIADVEQGSLVRVEGIVVRLGIPFETEQFGLQPEQPAGPVGATEPAILALSIEIRE